MRRNKHTPRWQMQCAAAAMGVVLFGEGPTMSGGELPSTDGTRVMRRVAPVPPLEQEGQATVVYEQGDGVFK